MSDLVQALRTFIGVAEQLSISAVAERSHASHTTIARRIDHLEGHFAARLFQRSTRRLTLTREGEALLDHARAIIEQIDHAEAELGGEALVRGIVRVGVTTALGLHYAARLTGLVARHPDLRIEFAMADWQDTMAEAGLDVALRVGEPAPESTGSRLLGPIPRVLVATPAYLAARGTPHGPADLSAHDCIAYGYGPGRAIWEIDGSRLQVAGCFRANSSEAVFRAVAGGLGIGLLPFIQVSDDIARGALYRVLPDAIIAPLTISVAHRFAGMRLPARIRAVLGFLVDQFPEAPAA